MRKKLGFGDQWINTIMRCISSIQYAVLINGQPSNIFSPNRGLRQGDPISPYLFLLCIEGLSSLLNQAKILGKIQGLKIVRGCRPLTHLFFADDNILFCRAKKSKWFQIQQLLSVYERASGQFLNRQKTSLFFTFNTSRDIRDDISLTTGVSFTSNQSKYLGLPFSRKI